jgi:hypothetical protein
MAARLHRDAYCRFRFIAAMDHMEKREMKAMEARHQKLRERGFKEIRRFRFLRRGRSFIHLGELECAGLPSQCADPGKTLIEKVFEERPQ